uniref:Profilin n=1 Tax=Panagrolaimus superbus TaxID=310955 RepID=A0A914YIQ2_9BILA
MQPWQNFVDWTSYLSSRLHAKRNEIRRAAIVGTDGCVWARSEGANEFRPTESEMKSFVRHFTNLINVPANGADLEGVHYALTVNSGVIRGIGEEVDFFAMTNHSVIFIIFCNQSTYQDAMDTLAAFDNDFQ